MSKFIDLEPKVSDYYGTIPGQERRAGICDALRYLDSHPDQVPGRTITESEAARLWYDANNSIRDAWPMSLLNHGITVIPDPEPTNAEKLEALLEGGDINAQWGLRGGGVMFARELAHALDEAGVKAPEEDDD